MDLPEAVVGLVMTRIDQLKPTLQLTLKVASVIGEMLFYYVNNCVLLPSLLISFPSLLSHFYFCSLLSFLKCHSSKSSV